MVWETKERVKPKASQTKGPFQAVGWKNEDGERKGVCRTTPTRKRWPLTIKQCRF